MPQAPDPLHIGASPAVVNGPAPPPLPGGAISESCRARSVLAQDGHDGVSDAKTSAWNSLWQAWQTYP